MEYTTMTQRENMEKAAQRGSRRKWKNIMAWAKPIWSSWDPESTSTQCWVGDYFPSTYFDSLHEIIVRMKQKLDAEFLEEEANSQRGSSRIMRLNDLTTIRRRLSSFLKSIL